MKKFIPPVGQPDFRILRRNNYGFVDKSLFIRDVLADSSVVVCFPRPRRFGKSTNLSMLGHFLRKTDEDLTDIFEGLEVTREPDTMKHFQKYPVISISFKDAKADTFADTLEVFRSQVRDVFEDHRYLLDGKLLSPGKLKAFERMIGGDASSTDLQDSFKWLSQALFEYHKQPVVILIDEYDTPMHAGYAHGYLDEVTGFLRTFMSACLKDNSALFKGVITGILRVARESMFSDLNHISVYSILQEPYATAFGFTANEVEAIVEPGQFEDVRAWYDGYVFGGQTIYNPWSILHYIKFGKFEPYWVNTGGTVLLETLALKHGMALSDKSTMLLNDGSIDAIVNPHIQLRYIDQSPEAFWNFLFFSGYLKPVDLQLIEGEYHAKLAIPNKEVKLVYRDLFKNWLTERDPEHSQTKEFVRALLDREPSTAQTLLQNIMVTAVSMFDPGGKKQQPEKLYHGFIVGLLVHLEHRFEVKSNPEAGYGRADVLIRPKKPGFPGIVLEFKVKAPKEHADVALESAALQARKMRYAETLHKAGCEQVIEYALAFDGKKVFMELVDDVLEKAAAKARKTSKKAAVKKTGRR